MGRISSLNYREVFEKQIELRRQAEGEKDRLKNNYIQLIQKNFLVHPIIDAWEWIAIVVIHKAHHIKRLITPVEKGGV